MSAIDVCDMVNSKLQDGDKKVTKTTLLRYVKLGLDSIQHRGVRPRVPPALLNAVRLHIKMQQLSRSKQATPMDIKGAMMASVKDTAYEGTFNIEAAWTRLRELYPEEISPSKRTTVENIRSEWTTYEKLDDWFTQNKPLLIKSGLAVDEPMVLPDGSTAELTIPQDCARRIINFDETDHPFSTQCDRGGTRTTTYGDPNLPAGSTRGIRGARHTTGVYATTAAGETMPPVYIFDTTAKNSDNFKVKEEWSKNLPTVRGKYGCPTTEEYPSNVCVRTSGCTDEQLFQQLISQIYLPLFPNCSSTIERDDNGNLLKGPIIIKTDSGQGRLAATLDSVKFRESMWEQGVYIVLGLPNSTSVSQEMDQLYQTFKGKCRSKTLALFAEKLSKRSTCIQVAKETLKNLGYSQIESDTASELTQHEPQSQSQEKSEDITKALKELTDALKPPTLNNTDLAYIVNGREGEKLHLRPFDMTFTEERIMKCNAKVGFVPFTRACLKNKNVRHELGQKESNDDTEKVVNEYYLAKRELKDLGFRTEGIFDVQLSTATSLKRKEREEDQSRTLLKKKGAFSASAIYTNLGTMCVSSPSITKVQRMQLEQEQALKEAALQKKQIGNDKKLAGAIKAVLKHKNGEKMLQVDWKVLVSYILPLIGSTDKPSSYKTTAALQERLSRLPEHWSTYVHVPNIDQISENLQDISPISQLLQNDENMPQPAENNLILEEEI